LWRFAPPHNAVNDLLVNVMFLKSKCLNWFQMSKHAGIQPLPWCKELSSSAR
jgi:hypothetical protein